MKRVSLSILACLFVASVVNAQSRTWVSGVGDDLNPCSRTAPCKTFAGAISKTAAGGEIDALDPAGYGAVTITKAITIDGGGMLASVLVSGTNGIVISAGLSDQVVLRNLNIQGIGSGINGVRVLSAKSVLIDHCEIANFTTRGIDINANATVTNMMVAVRNTTIHNNGNIGIVATSSVAGAVTLTLDGVFSQFNAAHGVYVTQANKAAITRSTFTNNNGAGVFVDTFNTRVSLSQSEMVNNGTGVQVGQAGLTGSIMKLSKNTISLNTTGVINTSSTVDSHQDNAIAGNTSDFSGFVGGIGQQ